jgi:hypothetical protein
MNNMWITLLPIIAKYGTEFAYKLWGNIKTNKEPTEADWQELIALSNKSYTDYLNEAQARLLNKPPVS